LEIIGEDVSNKGRIDLTVKIKDTIYILEFLVKRSGCEAITLCEKVDGKKGDSLTQIKEKNYHQKYLSENKEIYLLGIEFDSKEKNICNFEWERV
jgi:hypothetical protein